MFLAEPTAADLFEGFGTSHFGDCEYIKLISANIGNDVTPWAWWVLAWLWLA